MFRNKIVRADGTTEVLGIKQGSFHYHSQMETTGKIQVGNVISAFVEFSFYVNVNNGAIPVGEQIKYYQVTDVNSSFVEASTISENLIGTFNVTSSNTNKNICTIVAYDNISKLNVDYSLRLKEIQNQFPMRIRDLLDEAANYVGLTSNVGHYSRVDILYTGMLPAFYSDGITVRDLFAWAGTLVGDAIYAGAQGTIYQRSYGAKYNGQPWKYSHEYIIAPTDQDEYYNPSGLLQLVPVFYKQDSFHSEEYSVIPYDCVEVYKSDGSLFATYSPSGTSNKKYVVFGNVFLDFVDTPPLSSYANLVASDIYEYLQDAVKHSPMRVSLFPFRCPYGYGSGSTTYLYDITGEVVSIPIMSLDLTDESVIIEVFGEDEENGKHRQDFTADERATNLSAQINALDSNKVSKSGDTMTGDLYLQGDTSASRSLRILDKTITVGNPPSSGNQYGGSIRFLDSNNVEMNGIQNIYTSGGATGVQFAAKQTVNNALYQNILHLRVNADGTPFVYTNAPAAWRSAIGAVDINGDTINGNFFLEGTASANRTFAIIDKAVEVGTVPQSNYYDSGIRFRDKNSTDMGIIQSVYRTDDRVGFQFGSNRVINETRYQNNFGLYIGNSGTPTVILSSPSAWLSALGFDVESETAVSNIISANTSAGFSITSATYKKWGKVVQINLTAKKTSAVTTAGDITVGTLVSGKRPLIGSGAVCTSSTINFSYVATTGKVVVNGTWAANASKPINMMFLVN